MDPLTLTADVADYALAGEKALIPVQGDSPVVNSGQAPARQRGWMRHGANSIQFLDSRRNLLLPGNFPPRLLPFSAGLSVHATDPVRKENHVASNPPDRDCPMRATGELI